jgi:hypothetical protein
MVISATDRPQEEEVMNFFKRNTAFFALLWIIALIAAALFKVPAKTEAFADIKPICVSIRSGIAVLKNAPCQAKSGDEILYGKELKCYVEGYHGRGKYTVTTALGLPPGDVVEERVNAIIHSITSLAELRQSLSDTSFIARGGNEERVLDTMAVANGLYLAASK